MWLSLLSVGIGTALAAGKVSYPSQEVSLKNVHQIQIIGVRGKLQVERNPPGKRKDKMHMAVAHTKGRKAEDWLLSVERRGHTLFIEVFSTAFGRQWRRQVRQENWPEFDVEIAADTRPLVVSWNEGDLNFKNWNRDLDVTFLKGRARFLGGEGSLKLQAVQADVDVAGHKGAVAVQGQSGNLKVSESEGDIKLDWINGKMDFEKMKGSLTLNSGEAEIKARSVEGDWTLDLPKGSANLAGFSGVLKAGGGDSEWKIEPAPGADVSVVTDSGAVQVVRKPGRARIFLTSTTGEIKAPPELKSAVNEGVRVVEGIDESIKGAKLGQVFVKTRSGAIRFW